MKLKAEAEENKIRKGYSFFEEMDRCLGQSKAIYLIFTKRDPASVNHAVSQALYGRENDDDCSGYTINMTATFTFSTEMTIYQIQPDGKQSEISHYSSESSFQEYLEYTSRLAVRNMEGGPSASYSGNVINLWRDCSKKLPSVTMTFK